MEWPLTPWAQHAFYPRDNYIFYENSPEEIHAAVVEFLNRDNAWKPSDAQLAFNKLRWKVAAGKLEKPVGPERTIDDVHARYRLATRLSTARGVLGDDFLSHYATRQNEILSELHSEAGVIE